MSAFLFFLDCLRLRREKFRKPSHARAVELLVLHPVHAFHRARSILQQCVQANGRCIRVVRDGYLDTIGKLRKRYGHPRESKIELCKCLFAGELDCGLQLRSGFPA